ncbi:MAG: hypothetical protein WBA74_12015, partial [Cyclobacteriaceae bacterium]
MRKIVINSIYILLCLTGLIYTGSTMAQSVSESGHKIYIRTDQSYYISGETVYYSLALYNNSLQKPEPANDLIYVKLAGMDTVITDMILAKNGRGYGSIQLPEELLSGDYYIAAHTAGQQHMSDPFSETINVLNKNDNRLANCEENADNAVRIFAEGGRLVHGVHSNIVVKVPDNASGSADRELFIVTESDTIYRATPGSAKYLSFLFEPDTAQDIAAFIQYEDRIEEVVFPIISTQGISLKLEDEKVRNYIKLLIGRNDTIPNNILLTIDQQGSNIFSEKLKLLDREKEVIVPYERLADGLNKIELTDDSNRKTTRFFYKGREPDFIINTDKKSYKPREVITLKAQMSAYSTGSVSITKRKDTSRNIEDLLSASAPVPSGLSDELDNYLITWQDEKVVAKDPYAVSIPSDSINIMGQLFNQSNGKPLAYNTVTISFPSQEEFYTTTTDSLGRIDINVRMDAGNYYGIFHTFDNEVYQKLRFVPDVNNTSHDIVIENCPDVAYSGIPVRWKNIIENNVIRKAYNIDSADLDVSSLPYDFLSDLSDGEV